MIDEIDRGADVVIASRFQPGSPEVGVPAHRKFLSGLFQPGHPGCWSATPARETTPAASGSTAPSMRRLVARYGDNFLRENGFSCMLELLLNLRRIDAKL